MNKISSAILIDSDDIDNFINERILLKYGITNIITFKNANNALLYLKETDAHYELVLVDIYLPFMNEFEFIDRFYELELHKKQGKIFILSSSIDPFHKKICEEKNIPFIEKPLTLEKILEIQKRI